MKPYFEHTCHKCGSIGELDFNFAGPHIKAVCSSCGFYVKFFNSALIPDVLEIKMRINVLAKQDISLINSIKEELGYFYDGIKGIQAKIAYWKLYLKLFKDDNRQPYKA